MAKQVVGIAKREKDKIRLLKLLRKKNHKSAVDMGTQRLIVSIERKRYTFALDLVDELLASKDICKSGASLFGISDQGIARLQAVQSSLSDKSPPANRLLSTKTIRVNGELQKAKVNLDESPLCKLVRMKSKDGSSYISEQEFEAGERLRHEFARSQLEPRISSNWDFSNAHSGKSGRRDNSAISDYAIDAKARFNKALETLGPELSGVALDICCFLKGLEVVERERSWPPRSAKLMLKTALSALARHYGFIGYHNKNSGSIKGWGGTDYRPSI